MEVKEDKVELKGQSKEREQNKEKLKEELKKFIKAFRLHLATENPFFSVVAFNLKYEIDENLPSLAGTDCHETVYIRPDLLDHDWKTIFFVNLHELLHVIFLHSQRMGVRDERLWNVACDYAVNSVIVDEKGIPLPENLYVLYDPRFKGKSAEEIYNELSGVVQPMQLQYVNGKGQMKNEILKIREEEGGDGGEKEKGQDSGNDLRQGEDKEEGADGSLLKPNDLKKSKDPKKELEKVKNVLVQARLILQNAMSSKQRGKIPDSVAEFVTELLEPSVSFESILYATVANKLSENYTYKMFNKKYAYHYNVIYPKLSREEEPSVIVVIDTSGSMSKEDLKLAAGAIKRLYMLTHEITIITADCKIQQVIKTDQIEGFLNSDKIVFKGRGGASHVPVFEFIDKKYRMMEWEDPALVICITDGYTEYPKKRPLYPVIWLLTEDHNKELPPFGKPIVMKRKKHDFSFG